MAVTVRPIYWNQLRSFKQISGIETVVEKENKKVSSPGNDQSCAFCEMTVIWIQNQLREKGTKDQVLKYVNELCESLPSPSGESVIECDSISNIPDIAFTIGNKSFVLTPEQYILRIGEGIATVCISGFMAIDIAPSLGPLWYLIPTIANAHI